MNANSTSLEHIRCDTPPATTMVMEMVMEMGMETETEIEMETE